MTPSPEAQDISSEVSEIHAAGYERALTAPVVTDIAELRVTCRLVFALSEADELLISTGSHDMVLAARGVFQETMSPALRAVVERATGRTVSGHTSDTDLAERVTVETFHLAPAV